MIDQHSFPVFIPTHLVEHITSKEELQQIPINELFCREVPPFSLTFKALSHIIYFSFALSNEMIT